MFKDVAGNPTGLLLAQPNALLYIPRWPEDPRLRSPYH